MVVITGRAKKDLKRVPKQVAEKLDLWARAVETYGLEEIRKIPGYHDEPLKWERKGQRSIRLSLQWRAVYVIAKDGSVEFVSVEEVIPHTY
jgi:proteic killer suppression protein